jgi:hypothetical protein
MATASLEGRARMDAGGAAPCETAVCGEAKTRALASPA